jgi:hypothetical protein
LERRSLQPQIPLLPLRLALLPQRRQIQLIE